MPSPWRVVAFALLPVAATASARVAEPFLDYHEGSSYLPASPSVTGGAPSALWNPAAWASAGETESAIWWDDRALGEGGLGNWGLSIGRTLGVALQSRVLGIPQGDGTVRRGRVTDYQLGLATGDRRTVAGAAWRWSGGDDVIAGREHGLVAGVIHRPGPHLSYGASVALSTESASRLGIVDLGVRPFGSPLVTLFGDYTLRDDETLDGGRWGAGVELRPVRGVHLGVKLREETATSDDVRLTLNLGLTLDAHGLHVLPSMDESGDRRSTSYLVSIHPPHAGLRAAHALRSLAGDRRIVPISLENKTLTYTRDRYFDSRRVAWVDLLQTLDRIEREDDVEGIALNLAGLRTRGAIAWELRERLRALRAAGKTVIVHIDRVRFVGYYLASVADVVSIDPAGSIRLEGVASHRTYLAGTLKKVGIGFDEWRFFTHKSLLESYSRSDMSDADREQRQRIVDVVYDEVRDAVTRDRNLAPGAFDGVVDGVTLLTTELARTHGLVDRVGRWHDLGEWVRAERGVRLAALPRDAWPRPTPDERWGPAPELALVYALGDCEMDTGIRGRGTSAYLRALARDPRTVGVVVRADSPGGQALPSDLVAEGIRLVAESGRPVVVSQGSVAASGGYWLGAPATRILTTPFTATGSIGVAGGWAWNAGIGDKLGMTSDGVQRGAHADLFTGLRFPLIAQPLPERNLTPAERGALADHYQRLYGRFVEHVARSRRIDEARVREIAEGRVWMGGDAIERDLCDGFGTLADALEQARALAGLDPDDEVVIREYPERKLFTLPVPRSVVPSFATLARGVAHLAGVTIGAGHAETGASVGVGDPFVDAVLGAPGEPVVVISTAELPDLDVGE